MKDLMEKLDGIENTTSPSESLYKDLVNVVLDAQASKMLHPIELLNELQALVAKYNPHGK